MKKLGFGLMRLPVKDANDYTTVDVELVEKMADKFLENGFTYFDTAYPYHGGMSEVALREAVVKRHPRTTFTVTDKLPMFAITRKEQMEEIFDEQLERCGVEYFDYYWLHALGEQTYAVTQKLDAFGFIAQKKAEGKIKHIGFSFHDSPELLEKILCEHPETEYVQLQFNYVDADDATIQAEKCYRIATAHKKPVIVMEPVKGGALASVPEAAQKLFRSYSPDASAASWAVCFAASRENVLTVLSGMSTPQQLEDNTSYMKDFAPLNAAELQILQKAAEIIKSNTAVPCTACRYCVEQCPKNIAIPEYFAAFNNLKKFGSGQKIVAETYYANLAQTHGKASDCIGCGACEKRCPQHLTIREYLKNVSLALE